MTEPNKRERELATNDFDGSWAEERAAETLAYYRDELLKPFEELAEKAKGAGRNPQSAPPTFSGGVQSTWSIVERMLRDAIRRAKEGTT